MTTGFSIVISQSALDYILAQEVNQGKLMILFAQAAINDENKPVEEELTRLRNANWDKANFVRVFGKTAPDMEKNYEIKEYPTVVFIKNGVKVAEHVGLNPKPLEGILNSLMSEVEKPKST